jgi:hypothetical protein
MGADGLVQLHNRHHFLTASTSNTSQVTLGEGHEPYELTGTDVRMDSLDVYNDARFSRVGGLAMEAQDLVSQGRYGIRVYQAPTTLANSDADSLNAAQDVIVRYAAPHMRAGTVNVRPRSDPTNLFPQVLGRDLQDRVTITRTPPGGGTAFSQVLSIEHISHTITPDDWITSWVASPADIVQYWILGDAVNGKLGTTARLAF